MQDNKTAIAKFLSTLSVRRATTRLHHHTVFFAAFLSTLSVRRATYAQKRPSSVKPFLSTLSVRRATLAEHAAQIAKLISIHALREESDSKSV